MEAAVGERNNPGREGSVDEGRGTQESSVFSGVCKRFMFGVEGSWGCAVSLGKEAGVRRRRYKGYIPRGPVTFLLIPELL